MSNLYQFLAGGNDFLPLAEKFIMKLHLCEILKQEGQLGRKLLMARGFCNHKGR